MVTTLTGSSILYTLHIFVLVVSVGIALAANVFSLYLDLIGFSDFERGLVISMYALGALTMLLLWKFQVRLLARVLSLSLCSVVTGLVQCLIPLTSDLAILCLIQYVRGLVGCYLWAMVEFLLLNMTTEGPHRRFHTSLYSIMFTVGFAVGGGISVYLYSKCTYCPSHYHS